MNKPRRQNGFALLLTLVLLMIAGIALTAMARQSTSEALATRQATEELQRRWAVTSCRETLLPRVQGLLNQADQPSTGASVQPFFDNEPAVHRWVSCELAGMRYDLALTDEQAKYNPNAMQTFAEKGEIESALRALSIADRKARNKSQQRVALRPLVGLNSDGTPLDKDDPDQPALDIYAGYGQLLSDASAPSLLGTTHRPGASQRVTCWSDGRLHATRTPDAVIKQALLPILGSEGVKQLLEAREQSPDLGLLGWLKQLSSVDPERLAEAGFLLTESSNAQGLWIIARGSTRSWYSLSVRTDRPPVETEDESLLLDRRATTGRLPGTGTPTPNESADIRTNPDPIQRFDYAW